MNPNVQRTLTALLKISQQNVAASLTVFSLIGQWVYSLGKRDACGAMKWNTYAPNAEVDTSLTNGEIASLNQVISKRQNILIYKSNVF